MLTPRSSYLLFLIFLLCLNLIIYYNIYSLYIHILDIEQNIKNIPTDIEFSWDHYNPFKWEFLENLTSLKGNFYLKMAIFTTTSFIIIGTIEWIFK